MPSDAPVMTKDMQTYLMHIGMLNNLMTETLTQTMQGRASHYQHHINILMTSIKVIRPKVRLRNKEGSSGYAITGTGEAGLAWEGGGRRKLGVRGKRWFG